MKYRTKKINPIICLAFLISLSAFGLVSLQKHILDVKAYTWPIIVNLGHLEFGTVFPGERLQKNFIVSYSGSGIGDYAIVKKYKPLPNATVPDEYEGTISDYCQKNFTDFDRCYKYLCPYIEVYSEEGEGDIMIFASVDLNDLSDVWIVELNTPAIIGNAAQDHGGGIVTVNGEYGCDLSFEVDVFQEPYCGDGNLDPGEQCDDGNNNNGDGCSASCANEGGGGGGGAVIISLQINNAEDCVPTGDGAYFSWRTNMTSSSRVVCDTEPNPSWGTPPDYGYFLYTDELNLSPKVLNHEIEIPGLVPGESYYCRVISSNGSTTVFEEVICSIPEEEEEEEEGEVKGAVDVIIPEAMPKTGFGSITNEMQNIIIITSILSLFISFTLLRRKRKNKYL